MARPFNRRGVQSKAYFKPGGSAVMTGPYDKGGTARRRNKPIAHCPYDPVRQMHSHNAWCAGWMTEDFLINGKKIEFAHSQLGKTEEEEH